MSEMMTEPYAETRVYELGFHVLPTVGETGSFDVMKELVDMVTGQNGEILTQSNPEFMELSYPMLKIIENKRNFFETSYFGWVKFAIAADHIDQIENSVKARGDVLRHIVIKTTSENVELMTDADMKEDQNGNNVRSNAKRAQATSDKTQKDAPETLAVEASPEKNEAKEEEPEKKTTKKKGGDGPDDFKKIEGIGPKIAETITATGVTTYAQLAEQTPEVISEMITDVRGSHDPASWPLQAAMARDGQWDELKTWQDEHDGGKIAS